MCNMKNKKKAEKSFSSLTRPQLMEIPSLALSPVAPVLFNLSEPARSTKWNLAESVSQSVTSADGGPFSTFCNNSKVRRRSKC